MECHILLSQVLGVEKSIVKADLVVSGESPLLGLVDKGSKVFRAFREQ